MFRLEIMFWSLFTPVRAGQRISLLILALIPCIPALAFEFNDVAKKAKQLSSTSYKAPQKNISKALENLNYDQYRDIRFKPERAYWHADKLPFELTFFHQGRQFESPVRINEIVGKRARAIPFDPKGFNYGANKLTPHDLKHLGYAGFRVHYAINTPKYKDEVLSLIHI